MAFTPRGALIDLDGTLLDTAPDIAAATNGMLADFDLPPLSVDQVAAYVGKGADVLVHRALSGRADGSVDDAMFARGRAAFQRHYLVSNGTASRVYDGVPEALRLLRGAGLKLACVTNKPKAFTEPLLERVGLRPLLDATVSGDEVVRRKPHPDPLIEGAARIGLSAADVVMIGDSMNDLQAAHAGGIPAILVEGGYNEGVPLAALAGQPGLDAIVGSLLAAAQRVVAGLR